MPQIAENHCIPTRHQLIYFIIKSVIYKSGGKKLAVKQKKPCAEDVERFVRPIGSKGGKTLIHLVLTRKYGEEEGRTTYYVR